MGGEARLPGGLGAVRGGEIGGKLLAGVAKTAASQSESSGGDLGRGKRSEDEDLAVNLGRGRYFAGGDDWAEGNGGGVLDEKGE